MRSVLSPAHALIHVMVVVSASDADMNDRELHTIGELVKTLPAFDGFEPERLLRVAQECAVMLREPDGLEQVLGLVAESLPVHLRETAYLVALDVAFASRPVQTEEIRIVQLIRQRLDLDPLVAAALERAARARFRGA